MDDWSRGLQHRGVFVEGLVEDLDHTWSLTGRQEGQVMAPAAHQRCLPALTRRTTSLRMTRKWRYNDNNYCHWQKQATMHIFHCQIHVHCIAKYMYFCHVYSMYIPCGMYMECTNTCTFAKYIPCTFHVQCTWNVHGMYMQEFVFNLLQTSPKIYWNMGQINQDNTPFSIVETKTLDCQFGPRYYNPPSSVCHAWPVQRRPTQP